MGGRGGRARFMQDECNDSDSELYQSDEGEAEEGGVKGDDRGKRQQSQIETIIIREACAKNVLKVPSADLDTMNDPDDDLPILPSRQFPSHHHSSRKGPSQLPQYFPSPLPPSLPPPPPPPPHHHPNPPYWPAHYNLPCYYNPMACMYYPTLPYYYPSSAIPQLPSSNPSHSTRVLVEEVETHTHPAGHFGRHLDNGAPSIRPTPPLSTANLQRVPSISLASTCSNSTGNSTPPISNPPPSNPHHKDICNYAPKLDLASLRRGRSVHVERGQPLISACLGNKIRDPISEPVDELGELIRSLSKGMQ